MQKLCNHKFFNRLYIISDFKKLNYINNTKYAVYSHIKGTVNSKKVLKWALIRIMFKYEEHNTFTTKKNAMFELIRVAITF